MPGPLGGYCELLNSFVMKYGEMLMLQFISG